MDEGLVHDPVQILDSCYAVIVAFRNLVPFFFFHAIRLRTFSLGLVIENGKKLVTIGGT
jgi:hypothetical protein